MLETDFCQYVDVFYGNGETDRFFEDGLASKWFYIKALCGNTTPHAVLPFGKMSVGAYSGGYPSGYGSHYPNWCGGIQKMSDVRTVRGFSHLHHSGTGGIRYYYNYAVVTPFYGEDLSVIQKSYPLESEEAVPGYYKAYMQDVQCEVTVEGGVAVHRYTFGSDGGRLAVDFSNDGLAKIFGSDYFADVKNPKIEVIAKDLVAFSGIFSGIPLYFCVKAEAVSTRTSLFAEYKGLDAMHAADMAAPFGAVFDFAGNTLLLRVGFSTISCEKAKEEVEKSRLSLEAAAEKAWKNWNEHLSSFQIDTDDSALKQKFYSNLYHSLIKPSDMTGENVLGVCGDTVTDIATFWDQYKTALPLIYMCYPEISEKIVKGIGNISRTLKKIPCSFGLTDIFPCEEQAKMLGVITLCDAYYMGIKDATPELIDECIQRELERADFASFLENGYFERYTHILDTTDACLDVAQITKNQALKDRLLQLAQFWRNAYADDALMSEDSPYYEGDRYTYSFRIQKNMEERVALAGGKEKFRELLDTFFGFNGESVKQLTYLWANEEIARSQHHRFEGFNNECDMETPYAYIYADRHDRLCEIIDACVHRSFGMGRSGLPGNNDSGGLSSLLVWNVLGIFPVSGSGEFLIGSPHISRADITLANGNHLRIRVNRLAKKQIYVDRVMWNGSRIDGYKLPVEAVMAGGLLEFYMK